MNDNATRAYVGVVMEEYKTLRDESKQASINMWTAMQWGSALIGITLGVGLSQWSQPTPSTAIAFELVVPAFAALTMAFWLGEAARFKRVGDYLCLVEKKICFLFEQESSIPSAIETQWPEIQRNAELALNLRSTDLPKSGDFVLRGPLTWEQWLRARKGREITDGHLSTLYAMRLGFFLILAWGSCLLGLMYQLAAPEAAKMTAWLRWPVVIVGALLCLVATWSAVAMGRALNRDAGTIVRPPAGSRRS
jgi:hypothetical protein